MLPIRLGRLVKEYLTRLSQRSPGKGQGIQAAGRMMRNRLQYTRPGREAHEFTFFDETSPRRSTRNSNLRIAGILSPRMQSFLEMEAEITPLRLEDWQATLKGTPPDFLLVQSCLEKSGSWVEYGHVANEPSDRLSTLLAYCKREGIPSVFWDTEDNIHFPLFSKLAPQFDRVFAADPKNLDAYTKAMNRDAVHLGPAIQPVLHNPFKPEAGRFDNFSILMDGWADILEYPTAFEFLKPLFKKGLHITDSRYRFMANKLDDLPAFRENIMGCVSYGRHLSALRHYRVLVMPEKTLASPMSRSWQALEAMACGCSVVMTGDGQEGRIPEGLVTQAKDDASLRDKALELIRDDLSREHESHLVRREIYAAHTYAHRMRTICASLGIPHDGEAFPRASVVLATKRPELISACLETFHKQTYPDKELIIIFNTDRADVGEVRRMLAGHTNVHVFQVHQEKNIGACLNFGIAQAKGKYWFKMDDDDYYGANYLQDWVHLAETADFQIMGKPPAFIYLEEKDKLFLRNKALWTQLTIGSMGAPHLCGATLGGRREYFQEFSENHRACVDTDFVEKGRTTDRALLVGDIWNFVAYRARDKQRHTWRNDDEGIMHHAIPFCDGLNLDKVMV